MCELLRKLRFLVGVQHTSGVHGDGCCGSVLVLKQLANQRAVGLPIECTDGGNPPTVDDHAVDAKSSHTGDDGRRQSAVGAGDDFRDIGVNAISSSSRYVGA